jgi:hypothetical protein
MKNIFIVMIFLLYSNLLLSQQNPLVEFHNEYFKNSFVYSIESKTKSDFTVNITSKKDKKKVINKNHKNIIGKKFLKIDVSGLKKGIYSFKVLDNNLKVIFKKKIKKI